MYLTDLDYNAAAGHNIAEVKIYGSGTKKLEYAHSVSYRTDNLLCYAIYHLFQCADCDVGKIPNSDKSACSESLIQCRRMSSFHQFINLVVADILYHNLFHFELIHIIFIKRNISSRV